ncbi:MAG: hypothetical protein QM500_19305 [Methylococcales bacterium]
MVIGTIDINQNLKEISANPKLYRDQVTSDCREEEMLEFFEDKNQKVIDDLLRNANELYSLMTEFIMDKNEIEFYTLMRMAINSNDEAELGRLFKNITTAGLDSYIKFHRKD